VDCFWLPEFNVGVKYFEHQVGSPETEEGRTVLWVAKQPKEVMFCVLLKSHFSERVTWSHPLTILNTTCWNLNLSQNWFSLQNCYFWHFSI